MKRPSSFAAAALAAGIALWGSLLWVPLPVGAQVYNPPVGNAGTVTSVTCGTGLSGGTITASGTCAVAATAVAAGSYTNTNLTVGADGRLTAASNGTAASGTAAPQGRLTLTSATPVMSADALAQTTVYYDCYTGNGLSVGAVPVTLTIPSCEISMGLDAGVPHIASGSVYDIFGVSNAGTLAICAGPAWTSTTARGTGAGTTQIDQTNGGLWTNTGSLAHCWGGASGTTDLGAIAAHAGTYIGSVYGTANGQTQMAFRPAPAAGGNNNFLALYNAYNRVPYVAVSRDSTASWTYGTATWRAANAGGTGSGLLNRITYLDGLGQSVAQCRYDILAQNTGVNTTQNGCDFDSTSATPGGIRGAANTGNLILVQITAEDSLVALGVHFEQAVELVSSSGGAVYLGSTGTMALRLAVAD